MSVFTQDFCKNKKLCNNGKYMLDEDQPTPRIFCESANIGFTQEYFVFALNSGNQTDYYTISPQHAKRLQQYLSHQISEYERKNGEIKAKWDSSVISPLQRVNPPTDLS